MKVSVSLPDEDLAYVDRYAEDRGLSRSAVLHHAVTALRRRDLSGDYAAAMREWQDGGDADAWDALTADGVAE